MASSPPLASAQAIAITAALNAVMRDDRGRLLAALVSRLRNFQLAEDVLQEATMSALVHWARSGIPTSPQGWLLKVALRKAIDRLRKSKRDQQGSDELALLAGEEAQETASETIGDDRLRLIFTCCHPALEPKSRVALTLRCLGGLTTADIAVIFLDAEPTMGQRLSRAKSKIAAAGIRFAVPEPDDWAERLSSVLTVVYLIFTKGYTLGPMRGHDLCDEALYLARMLVHLRPNDPEIEGCLALILLTHARRAARAPGEGASVALQDQDRSLWDRAMIDEGLLLVEGALKRGQPGPFQIKAAIAACHVNGAASDWAQIEQLYRALYSFEPTPIVALNHAVALAESQGPELGLQALAPLAPALRDFQPYHAARAQYLAQIGSSELAREAYRLAIELADNPADAAFLTGRLKNLH